MNNPILNMLGIARRAGKLSIGHDAAVGAIVSGKAKLCLVACDGSERLKREMTHACSYEEKSIDFINTIYSMIEISAAIGTKAAVLTVDDEGFAKKIRSLYGEITENTISGRKD